MSRTVDSTTPVRHALKRLKESDTPLKRKNARKALKGALNAIWRENDTKFPKLRPDGSIVVPRKSKGAYCPKCNSPMRTWAILVDHMARHHIKLVSIQKIDAVMGATYRCSCGFTGKRPSMSRHLAGQGDLIVHLCSVVIANANEVRNDGNIRRGSV